MKSNQNKTKMKNHKFGILSLLISLLPIIWIIRTTIIDIFYPITFNENIVKNTYIKMNIFLLINIIGLVIGIMSLFKKGYKKTLAIWGIVINSIVPISMLIIMLTH